MRILRRITLIAVLLIISAFMLTACTSTFAFDPYNSKMSDNAQKLMNEDYLNEHETSFPFRDDGLPDDICVEIQSDEEFARAFVDYPFNVDFEKEFVILYFFTDVNAGFGCVITLAVVKDDTLFVFIEHKLAKKSSDGSRPPSASFPTHRCLAIKMDRVEYRSLSIIMYAV